MKIYLDACCLGRLTDDQSQAKIREEAAAVEQVLSGVRAGVIDLVSSEALEDEVRHNPSTDRRSEAQTILSLSKVRIEIDDHIAGRAHALVGLGYGPYDALHIAAAESTSADFLLTTDYRLLKRAYRNLGEPRIAVKNPVSWIKEPGS